ncbi:voltage-dependent calcium channel subunit alpha-2/delta-1 [Platysternon megacephalum]|uniref:Voltage-dependent calcium channel subunit alpha-2/delta-1 n=1 Tax=Platysternon megacephalum TaxID=55544 RepID=A0A4D9E7H8_9SAUR|nr:voltage-dependent calcium channel subunit alpha-2/delta-1 [Platysternon megacephalum]
MVGTAHVYRAAGSGSSLPTQASLFCSHANQPALFPVACILLVNGEGDRNCQKKKRGKRMVNREHEKKQRKEGKKKKQKRRKWEGRKRVGFFCGPLIAFSVETRVLGMHSRAPLPKPFLSSEHIAEMATGWR